MKGFVFCAKAVINDAQRYCGVKGFEKWLYSDRYHEYRCVCVCVWQVCDLAHALRDGVLLCQLLNNLLPQSVNLRQINLRPQMSQVQRERASV